MKFIKIKPLSINEAFRGRRFKTPPYKIFTDAATRLLLAIKPTKPNPDAPMFSHYIFGVSNMLADVDNMVKCFQDRLFSSWGILNKDHQVQFISENEKGTGVYRIPC